MPANCRTPTLRPVALAAAVLALAGCASPAPEAWRVAPSYRISHAGPGTAHGYVALARQYEGESRWAEALEAWRKAVARAPDEVEILDGLGIALSCQGRPEEAVATLRRAAQLAPASARRFNNLGFALMLAGRNDEARGVLRQAVALDPDHALARTNLGRLEPHEAPVAPQRAVATASAPVVALTLQTEPNVAALPIVSAPAVKGEADAQPEAAAPSALATLRVEIVNGNGITGMAASLGSRLARHGLRQRARLVNLRPYDSPITVVHYRAGYAAEAGELARHLPVKAALAQQEGSSTRADVRVVLGLDLRHVAACDAPCRDRGEALAMAGASVAR